MQKNKSVLVLIVIALFGVAYWVLPRTSAPVTLSPTANSIDSKNVAATLLADGSTYAISVPSGSSALAAMEAARSQGFTFEGKEDPAFGFFVESINGMKSANGFYWFLYVNGSSSPTGVSQTIVQAGDQIEWRYEKSQ